MSKSLSNAYLYINRSDYEVIGKKLFPGGNVENNVKSFCQDICVSDDFYEGLLQGPVLEDDVIRALLLLSLAAVESEVICRWNSCYVRISGLYGDLYLENNVYASSGLSG